MTPERLQKLEARVRKLEYYTTKPKLIHATPSIKRMVSEMRELLEAAKQPRDAEFDLSVCYFPASGQLDLTYEQRFEPYGCAEVSVPVSPQDGARLASIIGPCVYHRGNLTTAEFERLFPEGLNRE